MLQTYVSYVHIFKVCKFFQTAILKLFWNHFAKTAYKIANQNNFNYLKRILFSDKFSFQRCIICLCLWRVGGGGAALLLLLVFCKSVCLCMDLYLYPASFLYIVSLLLSPSLGIKSLMSPLPVKPLFSLTILQGQIS